MYRLKQQFHRYYSTVNQLIQKSIQELGIKQEKLKKTKKNKLNTFLNVIMFCKSVNYPLEKRCCEMLMV